MWNKNISTRRGLSILAVVTLPLVGLLAIPRFAPAKRPEEAVLASLRLLAAARVLEVSATATTTAAEPMAQLASSPATPLPSPTIVAPDDSRYAYRLQRTASGLRVHAWPLTYDGGAPYVFFMDEDGSIWTTRDPGGGWVGIHRPPPLDAGVVDPVAAAAAPEFDSPVRAEALRKDRRGRHWSPQPPRR